MKKITFLCLLLGTFGWVNGQVLNQNANWPNPGWTVTGTYVAAGLLSDPTTTSSFAFDDDRGSTGAGQEDNIAAESPVINLTAAFTAGETWLNVSAPYVYRYLANDELLFQYWNADSSTWVNWGPSFDALGNYTANANYCSGTPSNYVSPVLNIAGFTPTQLAGFKYRISYDDDPLAADYNWGFCFQSPTITSSTPPSCPTPTSLTAVFTHNSATLSWVENGSATLYNVEYGTNGFTQGTGTVLTGVSNSYNLSPLTPNTAYSYYVQASCGGAAGNSTWAGPFNFTTRLAPPSNDDCSGATALTVNPNYSCGTVTPGTVAGATASNADATACSGAEDDDVWFSFVATATTHRIVLSNVSGFTDMYHSLWTGDCDALTLVPGSCSDDNTSNPIGLVNGQTYYVRVNTYTATGGQTATFNICIGSPPPPPNNDECDGAIELTVNENYACGTVTAGTIAGATPSNVDTAACSGTEDDDVWYAFVATATTHRISLRNVAGSTTDMFHSLWTGGCDGLTLVSGSCSDLDTSNPTGLTVGETYYLRVYTWTGTGGQTSTFNVCIGTQPPPPPAPANDECAAAIELTVNEDLACGTVTPGTVAGATASNTDTTACGGSEDDDVWFSFVAADTTQRISLTNVVGSSSTDMFHSLWTGGCDGLTLVPGSCSDSDVSNPTGLIVGETYYIRVYTYTNVGGQDTTFNLCVGTNPPPPVNDECADAIVLTPGGNFAANALVTTNAGATNSTSITGSCQANSVSNVWYTFEVPASGSITIETQVSGTGGMTDSVVSAFTGSCDGTLTSIGCNDDGGPTGPNDLMSILTLTGRAPGETIYVSVWRFGGGTGVNGTFAISAYDASLLGTGSFDNVNFAYYPNPVTNILNLSYNKEISNVEIFNLLGQKVLANKFNSNTPQVDMSNLPNGTYMVKVTSDNQSKTIKVIKQ